MARKITVHYGACIADWNALSKFLKPWKRNSMFETIALKRIDWQNGVGVLFCTLFQNLHDFKDTHCKDPRDRIYAMLSISAPPLGKRSLVVDYSRELDISGLIFRTCKVLYRPSYLSDVRGALVVGLADDFGLTRKDCLQRLEQRGGVKNSGVFSWWEIGKRIDEIGLW